MAQQTTQDRVAIRATLHAAGILTEYGRVVGTWLETPDAPLFAMLEAHALHWSLYLALYDRKGKTRADRAHMKEHWETARRILDALAAMPALTLEGTRAKAAFALDNLTHGGKTSGPMLDRLLISALRDAIHGPARSTPPANGSVMPPTDRHPDATLISKLEELETARAIGRAHEPLGVDHFNLLPPPRLDALRRFLALEEEIAGIPATTTAGITAKLQAAASQGPMTERMIAVSAARDFLRLWEDWT